MRDENLKFGSLSIHAGAHKNPFGALSVPIYQTSTFVFDSVEQGGRRFALEEEGYIYSRLGNPTTAVFEEKIAALECGETAVATSSGIGAIASIFWTILKSGDHVVADKTLYGCTFSFLNHGISKFGVEVTFVDTSNIEELKNAIKPNTKIVYFETPANPNMKIVDIKSVADAAHNNPNTLVVVDNTFATPYCQKPIKLGVDIVVHSVTKYLNGHGDVIAGVVIGKKDIVDQIRLVGIKDMTGAVLGVTEAYYIIRGMKTLEVRMQRHCENAMKVAEYLSSHKKISAVYYPGLKNSKNYDIASKQMKAFGGIMAFELKDGLEVGKKLLNSLKLISLAVSLGDTETLIQHPASMTHSPYTKEERMACGITDGLVRLSVGLENIEDIIEDLDQGLSNV